MGNAESVAKASGATFHQNTAHHDASTVKKNANASASCVAMNVEKDDERSSDTLSDYSFHYSDIECIHDLNAEDDDADDTCPHDSTASHDDDFDITLHNAAEVEHHKSESDAMIDVNQLFMWNFDPNQHQKQDNVNHTVLSNIILNSFVTPYDTNMTLISCDIAWIILAFVELNKTKALVMEHSSYYTVYKYDKEVNKIRNVIGRMPLRNQTYEAIEAFKYIGSDALRHCACNASHKSNPHHLGTKRNASLSFPVKKNVIRGTHANHAWFIGDDMRDIWKHIAKVEVGINMSQHPIVLIVPSQTPVFVVEAMTRFAFERMNVERLCILDKSALILSLFQVGTALMVDISGDICSITPVIDWKVHQKQMILSTFHCAQRMNDDINMKLNNKFHFNIDCKCKMTVSKEEYDLMLKSNKLSKNKMDFLWFKNGESLFNAAHSISLKHRRKQYAIYAFDEFIDSVFDSDSDGKKSRMIPSSSSMKGLHELIMDVVCGFDDDDIRRRLMQNIVIYGSDTHTMSANMEQRLCNELTQYATEYKDCIDVHCLSQNNNVDIHYASHLSESTEFESHWITNNEYQKHSENIASLCVDKWSVTKQVSRTFNALINETFYESLLFSNDETLSLSPIL